MARRAAAAVWVRAHAAARCYHVTPPCGRLFDRLIPEDDAALKKEKDLERQAIERRMTRSKLAEMMVAGKEKVRTCVRTRARALMAG